MALCTTLFFGAAHVASAASPAAGARYTGVSPDSSAWAELDVSRPARSFRAHGSSIELRFADCGDPERRRVFHLRSRRVNRRISLFGRFAFVSRHGGYLLRVSGRFRTRNTAVVRLGYRRSPPRDAETCAQSGSYRFILDRVRRGHPAGCGQRGRTLAATSQARVFQRVVATGDEYVPYVNHAFGCLFARGRVLHLDEDQDPDSDLRLFRLAGPYAGYAQDACPMGCGYGVYVVDLRTGRKLRRIGIGTEGGRGGPATDLELAADGSLAWIVDGASDEVRASDASGERLLDSGAGIVLTSLQLRGSTLTWINGGVVRSASLR